MKSLLGHTKPLAGLHVGHGLDMAVLEDENNVLYCKNSECCSCSIILTMQIFCSKIGLLRFSYFFFWVELVLFL